jgi:hypothetical protein
VLANARGVTMVNILSNAHEDGIRCLIFGYCWVFANVISGK